MSKLLSMEPWPRSHVRPPSPTFPLELLPLVPRSTPWRFIWTLMFLVWQPEMCEWCRLRSWSYTLTSGSLPSAVQGAEAQICRRGKMESLVTDHPPGPTDKGLELLVGGVGLSAPHLVLSAALNRQKQPWFGQK